LRTTHLLCYSYSHTPSITWSLFSRTPCLTHSLSLPHYAPSLTHLLTYLRYPIELEDLLPGIIDQLGPDNLEHLKKIYDNYSPNDAKKKGNDGDSSDDDVPDLVESFEDPKGKGKAKKAANSDDDIPDLVESFEAATVKGAKKNEPAAKAAEKANADKKVDPPKA